MNGAVVFAVLLMAAGLATVWMMVCNERTLRQRLKIVDVVFDGPSVSEKLVAFHGVSYGEHMWSLFLLRDPSPRYGEQINRQLGRLAP